MHCDDPGCLKACPAPGAIVQYSNGIVDFDHENCIGCGYCVKGCPFNIPRISKVDHKAYKCTLCSDRVAVGQGPACAKACPTQAIVFGTKEDMKQHAERAHRRSEVARLRQCRALRSAGRRRHACDVRAASRRPAGDLCRPAEESEDQPAGRSSGRASAKYAGLAAIAAFAAVGFVHHLVTGPNRVSTRGRGEGQAARGGRTS